MILELEKGFGELIHISPQPMRQAAKALETESRDCCPLLAKSVCPWSPLA
jgi:hypothetical protein